MDAEKVAIVKFQVSKFGFKAHRLGVDSWVKSFQPAPLPWWDGLDRKTCRGDDDLTTGVPTPPLLH